MERNGRMRAFTLSMADIDQAIDVIEWPNGDQTFEYGDQMVRLMLQPRSKGVDFFNVLIDNEATSVWVGRPAEEVNGNWVATTTKPGLHSMQSEQPASAVVYWYWEKAVNSLSE